VKGVWPIVFVGLAGPLLAAEATPPAAPPDGLALLKKMASASRLLNYRGTFVYQHAGQNETSRIVHFVNSAGGEFEKLETLDGPVREVIRTNDQVTCYLPDSKTVIIEKRSTRRFPALLPEQLSGVGDNYVVSISGMDRVAGYDCQVVMLEPKDKLRYGHQFCAESGSGLPLRARTFSEKSQQLEAFAFTELRIGGSFSRDQVRSRYAAKSKEWKVDHSALHCRTRRHGVPYRVFGRTGRGLGLYRAVAQSAAGAKPLAPGCRQYLHSPGCGPPGYGAGRSTCRHGDANRQLPRIQRRRRQMKDAVSPDSVVPKTLSQ
jgi:hypothetical protein